MTYLGYNAGGSKCSVVLSNKGVLSLPTSLLNVPSCVGYRDQSRFTGQDAHQKLLANCSNSVINFKQFIGANFQDPFVQGHIGTIPCTVVEHTHTNGVGYMLQVLGNKEVLSGEQILATLLIHLQLLAEAELGGSSGGSECVLSVPHYFSAEQRLATKAAAKLAKLNLQGLVNENVCIANFYAKRKYASLPQPKIEPPKLVAFIDVGHTCAQASLIAFNNTNFWIIRAVHDLGIGGLFFDQLIRQHFLEQLYNYDGRNVNIDKRTWLAMLLEAEGVKKQMSASIGTVPFVIEGIGEEESKEGKINSAAFEQLASQQFDRLHELLKRLMHKCGYSVKQVIEVQLLGGSSNIPRIKQIVEEFFVRAPKLEMESAVAKGAAIQCEILNLKAQNKPVTYVQEIEYYQNMATFMEFEDKVQQAELRLKQTAESKNAFAEYCYGKLNEMGGKFAKTMPEEVVEQILALLSKAKNWMQTEGRKGNKELFDEELKRLKNMVAELVEEGQQELQRREEEQRRTSEAREAERNYCDVMIRKAKELADTGISKEDADYIITHLSRLSESAVDKGKDEAFYKRQLSEVRSKTENEFRKAKNAWEIKQEAEKQLQQAREARYALEQYCIFTKQEMEVTFGTTLHAKEAESVIAQLNHSLSVLNATPMLQKKEIYCNHLQKLRQFVDVKVRLSQAKKKKQEEQEAAIRKRLEQEEKTMREKQEQKLEREEKAKLKKQKQREIEEETQQEKQAQLRKKQLEEQNMKHEDACEAHEAHPLKKEKMDASSSPDSHDNGDPQQTYAIEEPENCDQPWQIVGPITRRRAKAAFMPIHIYISSEVCFLADAANEKVPFISLGSMLQQLTGCTHPIQRITLRYIKVTECLVRFLHSLPANCLTGEIILEDVDMSWEKPTALFGKFLRPSSLEIHNISNCLVMAFNNSLNKLPGFQSAARIEIVDRACSMDLENILAFLHASPKPRSFAIHLDKVICSSGFLDRIFGDKLRPETVMQKFEEVFEKATARRTFELTLWLSAKTLFYDARECINQKTRERLLMKGAADGRELVITREAIR